MERRRLLKFFTAIPAMAAGARLASDPPRVEAAPTPPDSHDGLLGELKEYIDGRLDQQTARVSPVSATTLTTSFLCASFSSFGVGSSACLPLPGETIRFTQYKNLTRPTVDE